MRTLKVLAVILCTWFITSCSMGLPDEKRYAQVHRIADGIDYLSIDKFVKEKYDNNDGVFGPSYYYIYYETGKAYYELYDRLSTRPNMECVDQTKKIYCNENGLIAEVYFENEVNEKTGETVNYTVLRFMDRYNGEKDYGQGN